jgi:hypothetical protein
MKQAASIAPRRIWSGSCNIRASAICRVILYDKTSVILFDHGPRRSNGGFSFGSLGPYSSEDARSHQALISAAAMRSPFDPSMKSTFKRQPGFR